MMNKIYSKSPKKKKKNSSKWFLSNYDRDSAGIAKSSRMPKTLLNSQQREVSPDLPLKKQATQDHDKRPKFHRKKSRENSLNFTVDN